MIPEQHIYLKVIQRVLTKKIYIYNTYNLFSYPCYDLPRPAGLLPLISIPEVTEPKKMLLNSLMVQILSPADGEEKHESLSELACFTLAPEEFPSWRS